MQLLRITLNLVVLVALLACLACGDDDPVASLPQAQPLPSELVGTWDLTSWFLNDQIQPLADLFNHQSSVSGTMTIDSNRTYSSWELDGSDNVTFSDSGSLTVSGNKFTLTTTMENGSPVPPESSSGTWAVNGDQLMMTLVFDSETAVITFTK